MPSFEPEKKKPGVNVCLAGGGVGRVGSWGHSTSLTPSHPAPSFPSFISARVRLRPRMRGAREEPDSGCPSLRGTQNFRGDDGRGAAGAGAGSGHPSPAGRARRGWCSAGSLPCAREPRSAASSTTRRGTMLGAPHPPRKAPEPEPAARFQPQLCPAGTGGSDRLVGRPAPRLTSWGGGARRPAPETEVPGSRGRAVRRMRGQGGGRAVPGRMRSSCQLPLPALRGLGRLREGVRAAWRGVCARARAGEQMGRDSLTPLGVERGVVSEPI